MSGSSEILSVSNAREVNKSERGVQDAKKVVHPYYQDTLSSMQPELALQQDELNVNNISVKQNKGNWEKFCDWVKGLFGKKETPPIPQKTSPTDLATKKSLDLYAEEMQEMNRRLREMNEEYEEYLKQGNVNAAEAVLLRLLAMMVKAQVKNKEVKTTFTYEQLNRNQKTVDETLEAKEEHNKDLTSLHKRKKILDGTSIALGILSGLGTIASIIFTVATGGLGGIPVAVVAINAILGVATAGSTLTKGITDHTLSKKEKETYLLDTQKELAKDGISMNVKEIDQTYNEIANYWNVLKDVAEKHRAAINALSRN